MRLLWNDIILPCWLFSAYTSLGCWKDERNRALKLLEGKSGHLQVHYKRRENPVNQCALAALEKGVSTFAVQDGGQCFGSSLDSVLESYQQYGESTSCNTEGTGGPMANSVYKFGKSLGLSIFNSPILILGTKPKRINFKWWV